MRKSLTPGIEDRAGATRGSLSMDREACERFLAQADKSGKTFHNFASEWIDAASRISARGGTARDTLELWSVYSVLRDVEAIPLPAGLVEGLISDLYAVDKEALLGRFTRLGADLANLLKMVAPGVENLAVLAKEFAFFVPTKRIEISQIDGKSVLVRIVGAGRKSETTQCSFEFVKAILNSYGYRIESQDVGNGTIGIRCAKRGAQSASGLRPRLALTT